MFDLTQNAFREESKPHVDMRLLILLICVICAQGSALTSHLTDSSWEDVISAGGLHVGQGRAKRFIGLNTTQPNIAYQVCITPNGKKGRCRHLQHCVLEDFKNDFIKYMDYLCVIKHSSLGACCPDSINIGPEALAGELPATALRDESQIVTKIVRAENRGSEKLN